MFKEKYILVKKRAKKFKKLNEKRLGMWTVVVFAIVLSLVSAFLILTKTLSYSKISQNLPSIENLPILLDGSQALVNKPTQFKDRNNNLLLSIENPYGTTEYISYDVIPQIILDIFLITEQVYFFPSYRGFDNEFYFSARLVEDFLLYDSTKNSSQKTKQIELLAKQVQTTYPKEKVVLWYLNHSDFGNHAYGINSAALYYFDKKLDELSIAEIALLAGIAITPDHNPVASPVLASEKQQAVLSFAVDAGILSVNQAQEANQMPIEIINSGYEPEKEWASYFDLVMEQANDIVSTDRLLRGGFEITTTIDSALQKQVECSTETHISRLTTLDGISDFENCEAARYIPSLRNSEKTLDSSYEAKVVILDTETGQVLAYLADNESAATTSSGTILSPFVFLTGFTRGYNPSSMLFDIPSYSPNDDLTSIPYHGVVSARESLRNHYLAATSQLISKIGIENVIHNINILGISSENFQFNSEFLEKDFNIDFLETSFAYSLFANNGYLIGYEKENSSSSIRSIIPNSILLIKDFSNHEFFNGTKPSYLSISSQENSYLINDILSNFQFNSNNMINPRAFDLVIPSSVQISSNHQNTEQWAIGYSPKRLVAVWTRIGDESAFETENQNKISPEASSYLWNGLVKYVHQNINLAPWEQPSSIVKKTVCYPSGLLTSINCLETKEEIFKKGDEPTQQDNLYQKISINRQTEKLATIFTPREYVEEKVFLVLPDEVKQWGYENDIVQPPTEYDFLFDIDSPNEAPFITTPDNFSYQNGMIKIFGTASVENFSSYRVAVGKGLYPSQWELIETNSEITNRDQFLGEWDSKDLNGLYIVRLQVIDEDNIISTAYAQLSVDNTPPSFTLLSPSNMTHMTNSINIQIEAIDNIGIETVKFLIDNKSIAEFSSSPYSLIWELKKGDYELTIVIVDYAGNQTETNYPIEIQ